MLVGALAALSVFAAALGMSPPPATPPAGAFPAPAGITCLSCFSPARAVHPFEVLLVLGVGLALGWWFGDEEA